jgi:hypothetical protein
MHAMTSELKFNIGFKPSVKIDFTIVSCSMKIDYDLAFMMIIIHYYILIFRFYEEIEVSVPI